MIADSSLFQQQYVLGFPLGSWSWRVPVPTPVNCVELPLSARWLCTAGYLEYSATSSRGTTLALTEKGRSASKDWKRVNVPTFLFWPSRMGLPDKDLEYWEIPVGTKMFGGVTGIRESSKNEAEVAFTYQTSFTKIGGEIGAEMDREFCRFWSVPDCPVGTDGAARSKTHTQTAHFQLYDDGWRISSIDY